jgi:hypothetical protein
MERRIVSVAAEYSGWKIQLADRVPLVVAGLQTAIVEACNLAREEHRASGRPTAVKVRMTCGDGVMMGYHG